MTELYVIKEDDSGLFWCNKDGWTELSDADVYTQSERNVLCAPAGGEWMRLPVLK